MCNDIHPCNLSRAMDKIAILLREANRALDWLAQFSDSKVLTTNQRDCQIWLEELAGIASPT